MSFKLDKKVKMKWVKALESGKFEQTDGELKHVDDDGKASFCCLGVAKECGLANAVNNQHSTNAWVSKNFLPTKIQEKLAEMNDNGSTFPQIAKYIKENL